MTLTEHTVLALSEQGLLAHSVSTFHPRPGQLDMAQAVANTLEQGGTLVVEAGTGIGKTYAYLVPALLSGHRVMVCTATKTLQDQLFHRDIPQLINALGTPRKTAVLKGRSSYLCIDRLTRAGQSLAWSDPRQDVLLGRVMAWSQRTQTGDLAELSELDERSPLVPHITSTRDNCSGSACPSFRSCHVNVARREALAADILVVNHHLFFSDLLIRESGMAELLPTVESVIFDEAHQLNETGVLFLGQQLSTGQFNSLARDCLRAGLDYARGLQEWAALSEAIDLANRSLVATTDTLPRGARLDWSARFPQGLDEYRWDESTRQMQGALLTLSLAMEVVREAHQELARLHTRVQDMLETLTRFLSPRHDDWVRWLEVGESLRLIECPMDIAGALRESMSSLGQQAGQRRSLVFTSASLGIDPNLRTFTESCGLSDATVLRIPSPFNYPSQAALYVPTGFPDPSDPQHSVAVARLAATLARAIQGRTLILTTSLRALSMIADTLQQERGETYPLEILVQGQQAKRALIERFRLGAKLGSSPCVLVASASFWEGLDLPGDILKLVVIDKLPFPSLSEPLVQARAQRLEALGRNVFKEYYLPQAALALRQGAGRLIRSEKDRGLLVICDGRLLSKSYGSKLLAALPPMRRLVGQMDLQDTLVWLTTSSTKDLNAT